MEFDIDAKKKRKWREDFPKLDKFLSYSQIMMQGSLSPENYIQWLEMYADTITEYADLDRETEERARVKWYYKILWQGIAAGAIGMLFIIMTIMAFIK